MGAKHIRDQTLYNPLQTLLELYREPNQIQHSEQITTSRFFLLFVNLVWKTKLALFSALVFAKLYFRHLQP